MITPSFNLTATERVLPRLALDWTTGLAQPGVDVTRAGVATFVGSNGLIQSATADTQRVDWSTGTPGLLVEESRTNLATQSQTYSTWSTANSSVAVSEELSPDGSTYFYFLKEAASAPVVHLMGLAVAATANFAFSCFAKASSRYLTLAVNNGSSQNFVSATFDLTNGTLGSTAVGSTAGTLVSAFVIDYGNGIYRCVLVGSLTGAVNFNMALATNETPSLDAFGREAYSGDGVSGLYVWGSQIEAGAFATSYIPTEASAVTRNADVATMTGTNFSDWYNPTEGTFAFFGDTITANATKMALNINDGTTANRLDYWFVNGALGLGRFTSIVSNSATADSGNSGTPVVVGNTVYGICGAYKQDSFAWAFAASTPGTDSDGSVPTVDRLDIGNRVGFVFLNGHVKQIFYWPQRIIDAEVRAFSK